MLWKISFKCGLQNKARGRVLIDSPAHSPTRLWQRSSLFGHFCAPYPTFNHEAESASRRDVCEDSPGLFVSSRHQRGSIARPLLSTADSTADKQQALLTQTLTPPLHVGNTDTMRSSTNGKTLTAIWGFFPARLTVVSLYSELPPSMMMSPASSRGT